MNIAQSLRFLMEKNGLSNSKLARELGVHTSTVSNWLDGKTVRAENLSAICEYFNCSMDFLAGMEKEKTPSKAGEGLLGVPDQETLEIMELLESRQDIRYLAAAAKNATPEHVRATAKMFDVVYGGKEEE